MRVLWRAGVTVAVVAGLAAVAVPVVLGSDLTNTSTGTSPPPRHLELDRLPDTLAQRWHADGLPPGGAPVVQASTVVVATPHRLEGRDPQTGATRWFYERRNATLCSWTTENGQVFAAWRKEHGCRDIVALNAGTGARTWTRNYDLNADIALTAMPNVLIASNAHALVTFDTGGGLYRWTYGKPGCALSAPVTGDAGVGLLVRCGAVPLVALLDTFSGKERFAPIATGTDARVLSTSQSVAVLSGGGQRPTVTLYGQAGSRLASFTDDRLRYDDPARTGATVYSGLILGWTGRALFAVPLSSSTLLWVADGTGPVDPVNGQPVAATADGFAQLELTTGKITRQFAAAHGSLTGLVRLGALVVATGPEGSTVYG